MADLNKVFLIGRLTQDPELRYTPNGAPVSNLRLATTRTKTTKDGDKREDTLFIDVTVWNRQAEICCQYLKKGSMIHVDGYLRSESWESPAGEKRSKIKVEADRVQFLDRRDDSSAGESSREDDYAAAAQETRRSSPASEARGPANGPSRVAGPSGQPVRQPAEEENQEEDIPF